MTLHKLSHSTNIKEILLELNVSKPAISIIGKKSKLHFILIKNLNVVGANILKQDALAIGAEVATPRGTIIHHMKEVDCMLIASTKQIEILSKKELAQPFGLKDVAKKLHCILNKKEFPREIMGVLNITPDSFYAPSRATKNNIIENINQLIENGADYIDIGAQSSRPQATTIGDIEELNRLKDIFKCIHKEKLYEKVSFSIDSYHTLVMQNALDSGFKIINDITGLKDDKTCEIAHSYNARLVIMHMQNTPKNMQDNPSYDNVITDIDDFFHLTIQKAKSFNCEDLILDVGIGFGKNLSHNLDLIKHLEHFTHFDYPLLVGASRKSMINEIYPSLPQDRLVGTLAIHQKALDNKASIIRCHDVKEHKEMMSIIARL